MLGKFSHSYCDSLQFQRKVHILALQLTRTPRVHCVIATVMEDLGAEAVHVLEELVDDAWLVVCDAHRTEDRDHHLRIARLPCHSERRERRPTAQAYAPLSRACCVCGWY